MIEDKILVARLKAFTLVGDVIWGCMTDVNALVRISTDNWEVEYVCSFPEQENKSGLFYQVKYCNGKLFFSPGSADCIAVYEINNETFKNIRLDDSCINKKDYVQKYKFENMEICNDKVFFIPTSYPAIIEMDSHTLNMKYYTLPFEDVKCLQSYDENVVYYFNCVFRAKNTLYLGFNNADAWLEFDMEKSEYVIKESAFAICGVWTVVKTEDLCILTSRMHRKAYLIKDNCKHEIPELLGAEISNVCIEDDNILFFLKNRNVMSSVVCLNKKTGEASCIQELKTSILKIEKDKDVLMLCANGIRFGKIDMYKHVLLYPILRLEPLFNKKMPIPSFCINEGEVELKDFLEIV